jgi:hypothetical protein
MKKLNIILMTSTLFLGTSTSVQAASGWWFAGGVPGAVVYATEKNVEKKEDAKKAKAKKKKLKKSLRARAEAQYNHRHASHKRH